MKTWTFFKVFRRPCRSTHLAGPLGLRFLNRRAARFSKAKTSSSISFAFGIPAIAQRTPFFLADVVPLIAILTPQNLLNPRAGFAGEVNVRCQSAAAIVVG